MSSSASPVTSHRRGIRSGYSLLLIAIFASYLISVAESASPVALSVLIGVQLLTVWLAMRVSQAPRLTKVAGVTLIVLLVALVLTALAGQASGRLEAINTSVFVVSTLLYLVAPITIVRHIVMRRSIDVEALLGVISAYLMIGMAFAFLYRLVSDWQPGDFFGAAGEGSLADLLFFSFTSLTTVGYGNLVPAANPGQSLAVFEAMIGQLFLVIVVAKVVTGLSRKEPAADEDDDDDHGDDHDDDQDGAHD